MKTIIGFVAALSISSTVLAGSKDLRIFNTLVKAGVETAQFMSQQHLDIKDVDCSYSNITTAYECNLFDESANEDNGAARTIKGNKAKLILELLEKSGAQGDSAMGKEYFGASLIHCSQAVKEVAEGMSAAQRTFCEITLEGKSSN